MCSGMWERKVKVQPRIIRPLNLFRQSEELNLKALTFGGGCEGSPGGCGGIQRGVMAQHRSFALSLS